MDVWLILPVLNEENALRKILPEVKPHFDNILVVDGNSTDNSRVVCEDHGIDVIVQTNTGKGNAIRQAWSRFLTSGADVACMIDADYTCDVADVLTAIPLIHEVDVVIGNRFHKGRPNSMGRIPRFVNWLVSMVVSIRIRYRVHDVQSPFWLWNRKAIDTLSSGVKATRFELEVDMVVQSRWAGLEIKEIPINYNPRIGKSKFSILLKFRSILVVPYLLLKQRSGLKV
ncbi:MAG: glycosyltransferase family 2 protein [Candidatus Kariarchaeaceae archaeon]|jgi:dolichol-phosphate mannosyltransferase